MIIYLELSDTDVSNLTLLFMKTVYTQRLHTMLNPIIFINKNLKLKVSNPYFMGIHDEVKVC